MEHQTLFSSKKKKKCCLLQFCLAVYRVKKWVEPYFRAYLFHDVG